MVTKKCLLDAASRPIGVRVKSKAIVVSVSKIYTKSYLVHFQAIKVLIKH